MTTEDAALRILGVEDGSFDASNRKAPGRTLLCGVLMKGDRILKVLHAEIRVDGLDATDKLLSMMRGIEVDAVILGGITFGASTSSTHGPSTLKRGPLSSSTRGSSPTTMRFLLLLGSISPTGRVDGR